MAKMGRPSDNPRRTKLSIRLSDGDKELLEEYCKREKVTRTEAVSRGIQKLMEKRAIREAEEEWKILYDVEDRKRKEMFELDEQRINYIDQRVDLNREDFDTEEAYQAEYERLELKYEEAMKEFEKAREEWKEAEKREQEAYERYDRKRRA